MDRNYLKGRLGDRINTVLAAAGYNFGLLLRWLAELLRVIIQAFIETVPGSKDRLSWAPRQFFTDNSAPIGREGGGLGYCYYTTMIADAH